MRYNTYLIAGITLITVMLLFLFSGFVSETGADLLDSDRSILSEDGYSTLLLGIGLPLILAIFYILARMRKGRPVEK